MNSSNARLRIANSGHFCAHHNRAPERPRDSRAAAGELRCFSCPYESAEQAEKECPDYEPARATE